MQSRERYIESKVQELETKFSGNENLMTFLNQRVKYYTYQDTDGSDDSVTIHLKNDANGRVFPPITIPLTIDAIGFSEMIETL